LLIPVKPVRAVFTWCNTDCDPTGPSDELTAPGFPVVEEAGTL
jgi:hypothetical protein